MLKYLLCVQTLCTFALFFTLFNLKSTKMKTKDAAQLTAFAISNRLPIMLVGSPGIGKTSIIKQVAGSLNSDLVIMHPVVSDPTDFKGLPFAENGKAHFLPFGELNKLIEASKPLICFLDDLGQAPASVQAACMQLILERRINGHKVSDNVTFCAATNRASDKAGVTGILEPVKSRFAFIAELDVNVDDWTAWAIAENLPFEVISFIRFRPEHLTSWKPEREIKNQPCPRTIEFLARAYASGVPSSIEFDAFKAIVGEACAAEFTGFLKVCRSLPDPDQIFLNPKGAQVPDEPSAMFAISGALHSRIKPGNFEAATTYVERLPAEYQVVFMKDTATHKPELTKTKPFISWASKNSNIIF